MPLSRVLEPELMDSETEAHDYDAMDHAEVNAQFCADLVAELQSTKLLGDATETAVAAELEVLDVGTGTALIPIELCRTTSATRVVAIDLAEHMLSLAKDNIARAGLASRITVAKVDAKEMPWPDASFVVTMSNSIIHHIPEPSVTLREMWRVTKPGGLLFVRDLVRPESAEEVERLTTLYGGSEPVDASAKASWSRARSLLADSLRAALTLDEVAAMTAPLGIAESALRLTSDRHWTLAARKG